MGNSALIGLNVDSMIVDMLQPEHAQEDYSDSLLRGFRVTARLDDSKVADAFIREKKIPFHSFAFFILLTHPICPPIFKQVATWEHVFLGRVL